MNLIYGMLGFIFSTVTPRSNTMHMKSDAVVVLQANAPKTNIGRILAVMADGKWRTINVIKEAIQTQFGVATQDRTLSAQLRDIRKKQAYVVNVKKVKEGLRGVWEYQVLEKDCGDGPQPIDVVEPRSTEETQNTVTSSYDDVIDQNVDLDVESFPGDEIG